MAPRKITKKNRIISETNKGKKNRFVENDEKKEQEKKG